MNVTYDNALATHGATQVTFIGLLNGAGVEITGGSPAYARRSVTWTAPSGGLIRPTANLTFDIPGGANVAFWNGYSAITGGTDFGSTALPATETYAAQGRYELIAANTGIQHTST